MGMVEQAGVTHPRDMSDGELSAMMMGAAVTWEHAAKACREQAGVDVDVPRLHGLAPAVWDGVVKVGRDVLLAMAAIFDESAAKARASAGDLAALRAQLLAVVGPR